MNLRVGTRNIEFFNDFNFTLSYNSLASTFDFRANYDPNNSEHRFLFRPLSYHDVIMEHNGERLITGSSVNSNFNIKNAKDLTSFSGYSKAGILEDCTVDIDQYPLEFNNLSLKEITEQLIKPFDLSLKVDESAVVDANIAYEEVTASDQKPIKQFLADLAFERGLILTHDEFGVLVYTKTNTSRQPVVNYVEGTVGVSEMALMVNGQGMHSKISAQQQSDVESDNASEASIINPLVKIFRPIVKRQTSGTDNDTEKYVRSLLGAELRKVRLRIKVYRWEWVNNGKTELIRPNNVISVVSPNNGLFKPHNWFVESVTFIGNQKEQVAELIAVPVDAYSENTDLSVLSTLFDG